MLPNQIYPSNIAVENFQSALLFTGCFRIQAQGAYRDSASKRINKLSVKFQGAIEITVHVAARVLKDSRRASLTEIKNINHRTNYFRIKTSDILFTGKNFR